MKDHFDKVLHMHQSKEMASTFASGFTNESVTSAVSSNIMRNRSFANQTSVDGSRYKSKPMYFYKSSNGTQASDPNSLRDMGRARNCEYQVGDEMDRVRDVSWKELIRIRNSSLES